jgi:hypothetical protein
VMSDNSRCASHLGKILACLLFVFLVAAVVSAVGVLASPCNNQGGSTSRIKDSPWRKAMANLAEGATSRDVAAPANIIAVTNTNDSGPGSLPLPKFSILRYQIIHRGSRRSIESCGEPCACRSPEKYRNCCARVPNAQVVCHVERSRDISRNCWSRAQKN